MAEAEEKEGQQGPPKADSHLGHAQVVDLLVANIIPTTKYFESRFDFLQHQIDQLREGQKHLEETMNRRFEQVDKRFEQVDKRLEQIVASIDRLGDKLDHRDLHQRNFTIRMFMISITLSFLGVLGVLLKIFGVV